MKRGPKTAQSDEELVVEIRRVLKASPFTSEGHRKVRARLRAIGIRVGKDRVLRLMRENRLLVPHRAGHRRGDRAHAGSITTDQPDELWGTDATRFYTRENGWCWFFGAIDHCCDDYEKKIALGLGLRHDWGSQYAVPSGQRTSSRGSSEVARDPIDPGLRGRTAVQRGH